MTIAVSSLVSSIAKAQGVIASSNQLLPTQRTTRLTNEHIKWDSKIPLDKTYGELTPAQKFELHSLYDSMPEGDEPPFNESSVRMTEVTQQILMLTRYKPGICNGQPCVMQFRFTQKLRA